MPSILSAARQAREVLDNLDEASEAEIENASRGLTEALAGRGVPLPVFTQEIRFWPGFFTGLAFAAFVVAILALWLAKL